MRSHRSLTPTLLLALALLSACSDRLDAPIAGPVHLSRDAAAQGSLRDADIDRGDSHFSATVSTTTEFEDHLADAFGAADLILEPIVESAYIEGGYAKDGSVRFGTWFDDAVRSPDIGSVRLEDGRLNVYDHGGLRTASEWFDLFLAMVGLPGGSVQGAFFPMGPIAGNVCYPGDPTCGPAMESTTLPPGATVTQDGDLMELRWSPTDGEVGTFGTREGVEVVQRFRRLRARSGGDDAWRLEETVHTTREMRGTVPVVTRRSSRIAYGAWRRNPVRDSLRLHRAREAVSTAPTAAVSRPLGATAALRSGSSSGSSSGTDSPVIATSPDASAILGRCGRGVGDFDRWYGRVGGIEVVYQHGLCSEATVFQEFDARLSRSISIARARAFSLESTDRVEDQVTDLRAKLTNKPSPSQVMIGHSQGGLVVRRFGQRYPEMVRAVLTIGTPHQGAYLADFGPESVRDLIAQVLSLQCFAAPLCDFLTDVWADVIAGRLTLGLDAAVPVFENLRTGSPFHAALNSTPEFFPRVGIETVPSSRWNLARMVGDDRSPFTRLLDDKRPGGDALVTSVAQVYAAARWMNAASIFLMFTVTPYGGGMDCNRQSVASYWPGCSYAGSLHQWYTAEHQQYLLYLLYDISGRIMALMDRVDGTWNYLVDRKREGSDGLVHQPSQRYPNSPGTYAARRVAIIGRSADAHSGQPKSPAVMLATIDALRALGLGGSK